MTSLKKLTAVLAVSLPLAAAAQQPAAPEAPAAAAPAEPAAPAPAPAPPPAVAAPAVTAAAKPLFQIYGSLNLNAMYTQATGATAGAASSISGRTAVSADSSNLGIRGTADLPLPYALGVVYQCEISAKLDGIVPATGLCDRNSRLGVSSAFGTLFYGNWDTPYKAAIYGTKADDPFDKTDAYGFNDMFGSPGFNKVSQAYRVATKTGPTDTTNSPPVSSFDLRAQNSIGYHSPKIFGASAKVQYVVPEFASQKDDIAPSLFSAVVNYDAGPLSVLAAYERHDDAAGIDAMQATTSAGVFNQPAAAAAALPAAAKHTTKDQAFRAGAGWEQKTPFGATTVGFLWEQLRFEQSNLDAAAAGAVKEFKRAAYMIALKHRLGNHELKARYNWADSGTCTLFNAPGVDCKTTGYSARQWAFGYGYYLSKAAQVYVHYTQIENARNAQYTLGAGGGSTGSPLITANTPKGADPMAAGIGLKYAF